MNRLVDTERSADWSWAELRARANRQEISVSMNERQETFILPILQLGNFLEDSLTRIVVTDLRWIGELY